MTSSVMITTRNRAADLATTLRTLSTLSPALTEILITFDACTDDSRAVVAGLWPAARVFENPRSLGSIPSRDRMLRAARTDLVLSLDDDSYPLDLDFLAKVSDLFAADPKLAVLWFPQRSEEFPASLDQFHFGPDQLTGSFSSSGAVIRRSAYLSLPGYPALFGHAYEEPDFGLQCIAADWKVRLHTGLTIRHHYSTVNRNELRTHHLHARNEAWSVLLRCPSPWWPFVLLRRAAGQFAYAAKRGPSWIIREPQWWWRALFGAPRAWRDRNPVPWSAYRRWRRLLRHPEPLA
jgi:GT2 family glycosyltransferase